MKRWIYSHATCSGFTRRRSRTLRHRAHDNGGKRLLILGAGTAAAAVIRELGECPGVYTPVACLDDDRGKWGLRIGAIPIVGGCSDVVRIARELNIHTIIIAIPSAPQSRQRALAALCGKTGRVVLRLPSLYRLATCGELLPRVERVELGELLGRASITMDTHMADSFLRGRRVMVTGGGGSIGSELCRQIAAHCPSNLVVLDFNENNAFGVCEEIKPLLDGTELSIAIASVRDRMRMDELISHHRPDILIHAAAHKHLPLMEEAPGEAIKNNVAGCMITADLAGRYGCGTFVFVSTDKAVNPTCVMGRTKRVGELVAAGMTHRHPATRFISVRFGNVLGSSGSVVPLFKQQIAAGGPLRVTHPEATRYFMTIPEAAGLVLTAGAMAEGSEIFVLDMGQPVRILDLAENLIRMAGLVPYRDIGIVFTGLRPGEKLHEQLLSESETVLRTAHPRLHISACRPLYAEAFLAQTSKMCALAEQGRIREALELLVSLSEQARLSAPGSAGEIAALGL